MSHTWLHIYWAKISYFIVLLGINVSEQNHHCAVLYQLRGRCGHFTRRPVSLIQQGGSFGGGGGGQGVCDCCYGYTENCSLKHRLHFQMKGSL